MLTAHIIRIGPAWLRVPLLVLLIPSFLFSWVWMWVGMPTRDFLQDDEEQFSLLDSFFLVVNIWIAAALGMFVPDP